MSVANCQLIGEIRCFITTNIQLSCPWFDMPCDCNVHRVKQWEMENADLELEIFHNLLSYVSSGIFHYNDVIMSVMASQITSLRIVCSTICSGTDQRKHQSSTSLAFVTGIHQCPLNSLHKGPIMWKMFPFDDVIMYGEYCGRHLMFHWIYKKMLDCIVCYVHASGVG